jgi:anti-sigma factor RsiW
MTEHNAFEPERDEALGALLHEHLSPTNNASFTERVMSRIRLEPHESSWEVLAGWAPLGMAAAAILALATGLWLGSTSSDPPVVATDTADPVEWLSTSDPVTTEFVLTAVLVGDRFDENGAQR